MDRIAAARQHCLRLRWPIAAVVAVLWLLAASAGVNLLMDAQADVRRSITQRLQARVIDGAEFASLYVRDLLARERAQAREWLVGRAVDQRELRIASEALGAQAAVLLDANGDAMRVLPAAPQLIGADLASRYAHLRAAVDGHAAVSDVVPSAVAHIPVTAFAIPFAGHGGRRVFSIALSLALTPLGVYVNHVLVVPGHRVELLDAHDTVIATSHPQPQATTLADIDPRLAALAAHRTLGSYAAPGGRRTFVTARIAGTPWRIVAAEPSAELYSSIDARSDTLAWYALAGLTLAGLVIIVIGTRLTASRARHRDLARQLDRLARVDALTELSNRRDLSERLEAAISASQRTGAPLSVLLIDIDHFKRVNDRHGHKGGDAVLVAVAAIMRQTLRVEDAIGRWGGEEFLAVLPGTDSDEAATVAERVRARVAGDATVAERAVTVTIGVAQCGLESAAALVHRADTALYAGKLAGRDTVQVAPEPEPLVAT